MAKIPIWGKPDIFKYAQGSSCHPNEVGRRKQRRCKRPESRSRSCGKELKRWDPTMPETFALMGLFEWVMFLLFKSADAGNAEQMVRRDLVHDASRGTQSGRCDHCRLKSK